MSRLAALFLCALAALVATATPAPEPKAWVTGWDKPVDPKGDCKFEREGERLTITVPGEGHELDFEEGNLSAPRLLHDAEGDLMVEARVSGDTWVANSERGIRRAGLLVMGDEKTAAVVYQFEGQASAKDSWLLNWGAYHLMRGHVMSIGSSEKSDPPKKSTYLRLSRRGDWWVGSSSDDGKEWYGLEKLEIKLPRKVKVGVYAVADVEGTFKVVFGHFKLTRPA